MKVLLFALMLVGCTEGFEVRTRNVITLRYTCTQWVNGNAMDLAVCETMDECNKFCEAKRREQVGH